MEDMRNSKNLLLEKISTLEFEKKSLTEKKLELERQLNEFKANLIKIQNQNEIEKQEMAKER